MRLAAPVLRSADVTVAVSASTCDVTMRLSVEGADEIDHRLDSYNVDLIDVTGAERLGEMTAVGRTRSLVLRPTERSYQLHYNARLAEGREFRCPLWLPTIPTDGQPRAVGIHVQIPAGAMPSSDSMPMLSWNERHGEATLAHLPAFVYVPFTAQGATAPWSMSRTMDTFTIVIIVVASALWAWLRKR